MTTVAIVEDNLVTRDSFRQWIDAAAGMRCVFACATAEEALWELPTLEPDVVLMDINLPGESGIKATTRLKKLLPTVQVIIVTVYRNHELILQALQAGACGYLLKRSNPEELLKAIAEARSGGAPMTSEIARVMFEAFQRRPARRAASECLTSHETELLSLLSEGLSNTQIVERINIGSEALRAQVRNIYAKLYAGARE